jgi:hypothetical protein
MFGIKRDITLSDLFNEKKFYYKSTQIERVIEGEAVIRKRYTFFPVVEAEPVRQSKNKVKAKEKKAKKVETFIPLF